ncbi:MAG: hypothetical protein ACREFL_03850, partial [Stellaceae bacterium]
MCSRRGGAPARHEKHRANCQRPSPRPRKSEPTHRPHHTAAPLARLAALGAILALAACSESAPIHPFDSVGQINWTDTFQRVNQPGLLGAFIDRRPPAATIRASGPYPGP